MWFWMTSREEGRLCNSCQQRNPMFCDCIRLFHQKSHPFIPVPSIYMWLNRRKTNMLLTPKSWVGGWTIFPLMMTLVVSRHHPQFWSTSTSPPKKIPHSSNWINVPIEDFTPKIHGHPAFSNGFLGAHRCRVTLTSTSWSHRERRLLRGGPGQARDGWAPPGWGGGGRVEEDTATRTYRASCRKKSFTEGFFQLKAFLVDF